MYKQEQWPLTLYFDGDCPLCAREIKLLRARATADRLLFVDISEAAFDAASLGLIHTQMEDSLHARFDDGTWVTGLDATLWSWRAAGLGAWAAPLSWRWMRPLLTVGYRLFAAGARTWRGCPIPTVAVVVVTTVAPFHRATPPQAARRRWSKS